MDHHLLKWWCFIFYKMRITRWGRHGWRRDQTSSDHHFNCQSSPQSCWLKLHTLYPNSGEWQLRFLLPLTDQLYSCNVNHRDKKIKAGLVSAEVWWIEGGVHTWKNLTKLIVEIIVVFVIFIENGTVKYVWMIDHLCQGETSIFVCIRLQNRDANELLIDWLVYLLAQEEQQYIFKN